MDMNEYINVTLENIDNEHICCAIGDSVEFFFCYAFTCFLPNHIFLRMY